MSGFDGSGTYVRYYNWTQDAANAVPITASRFDTEHNGFATALSNCLTRDSQGKPSTDIDWNAKKLKNLADPTLPQDAVTLAFLNGTSGLNYLQSTQVKYNQTAAESAAGVTPVSLFYPEAHLFRYMTAAQITSWLAMDLAQDCTTPIQNLIKLCESNIAYGALVGFMPAGKGKITASLSFAKKYCHIYGAGRFQTAIDYSNVGTSAFLPAAQQYWSPWLHDFQIIGNASSGHAIDTSNITVQVYDGQLERLHIEAGKNALYIPLCFSMGYRDITALSYTEHVYRVKCGNTVEWRNVYAISCPVTKAGYRLAGNITMYNCNGIDSTTGVWGIFGNDSTATDGWQGDFTGDDLPAVILHNCNVEAFVNAGVIIHNSARCFRMIGGKLDRSALATNYHSMVWARAQGQTQAPIHLEPDYIFTGAGDAKGGTFAAGVLTVGALTGAQIHAGSGAWVEDANGLLASNFTGFYADTYAAIVPFVTQALSTADVTGGPCKVVNAMKVRRITQQVTRFDTLTTTPGAAVNQNVDVTGYTKVKITASGAYTVDKFTFNVSDASHDIGRNGELIVETGDNGNVTLNHNVAATGGMRMTGAANLTLAAGRVVRFLWSDNYQSGVGGWIQT